MNYDLIDGGAVPIRAWTKGVLFEEQAKEQLRRVAQMPFVTPHVAVMPDVHAGIGSTVGGVIPTLRAIIPAAVGVDLGCGVDGVRTSLTSHDVTKLKAIYDQIALSIPHGRTNDGGANDRGSYSEPDADAVDVWNAQLRDRFMRIVEKNPSVDSRRYLNQFGTLGTGNHFIEVCVDETDAVW